MQFERRTEASATARLLRPDSSGGNPSGILSPIGLRNRLKIDLVDQYCRTTGTLPDGVSFVDRLDIVGKEKRLSCAASGPIRL